MSVPRFRIPEHVHARAFDGELVLLHLERGEYFSLDAIGTLVWEAIASGRALEGVAAELAESYAEPHGRVSADIDRLVDELVERGLLERVFAKAPAAPGGGAFTP